MKLNVRGNKVSRKSTELFFRPDPELEQGSFDLEREVPANVWNNLDLQLKHIKEDKDQPGYVEQLIELAGVLAPVRPNIREQFRSNSDNITKLLEVARKKLFRDRTNGRFLTKTPKFLANCLSIAPEVRSVIQEFLSDKLDEMISQTKEYWRSLPPHPQLLVETRVLIQLFPEQRAKIIHLVHERYPNIHLSEKMIDDCVERQDWAGLLVDAAEEVLLFPERVEKIKLKIAPHWPAIKSCLARETSLYVKRELMFAASIISAPEVSINAQGLIEVKRRQPLPPTVPLPERPTV